MAYVPKVLRAAVGHVMASTQYWCALSVLLLTSFIATAHAANPPTKITLGLAIARSLERNPSLKVFSFRKAVLQGALDTANLNRAIELGAETENFAGSRRFTGVGRLESTISLSSIIEMGDKRAARVGFVHSNRSVLKVQLQVQSLALLGEVTRRYIKVLGSQERVALAREALHLAQAALRVVKKRAKAGATPGAEVKRALAASVQAKLALVAAEQRTDYLRVALASLWGETSPPFYRVSGDLFRFGKDIDFATLFSRVERNPVIRIFAAQQQLGDAEIRLAKTKSSADISWSIGVRRLQESNDTALVAGFSIPLFSSSRNKGVISSALARRNEIYVKKEAALLNIHAQLFRAFQNRRQAKLTVKRTRKEIIPLLQQALTETQQAYQRGRYSYLEYVSARQELLAAKTMLIESASAALTFGAEIEQLTAEPLAAQQYQISNQFQGRQR